MFNGPKGRFSYFTYICTCQSVLSSLIHDRLHGFGLEPHLGPHSTAHRSVLIFLFLPIILSDYVRTIKLLGVTDRASYRYRRTCNRHLLSEY